MYILAMFSQRPQRDLMNFLNSTRCTTNLQTCSTQDTGLVVICFAIQDDKSDLLDDESPYVQGLTLKLLDSDHAISPHHPHLASCR